ncbi:MAG: phosphate signaling complex protein PhoU [Acidimicrobiia bacterium]
MLDTRRNFHHELELVRDDIVRMAGMVTEALAAATRAFLDGDLDVADRVRRGDAAVNALNLDIEDRCFQLLALQQPMASDLRSVTAAIRLCAEIERSGDLVVNITKGFRRIYGVPIDPRIRGLIERLGDEAHRLFRLAIDAYVERDAGLANALDDMDDAIDDLHVDYIESLFEVRGSGELTLQAAVQLALIGRFYERIADHAVNIGERVYHMVTGDLPAHMQPHPVDGTETAAGSIDAPGDPG